MEKSEQERQQQEAVGRTTPITISDEEQPTGGTTKDIDESPVTTEAETNVVSEQPPKESGVTTEASVAAEHLVKTNNRQDSEVEVEQQEQV